MIHILAHVLALSAVLFSVQSFAAGFRCETEEGLEIVVEHTLPRTGQPTRTTRFQILEGNKVLLDRNAHEIQRYREGNVFNYVVKGNENLPVAVASLEIEFPGWRDFLAERESAQGSFRIRERADWKNVAAECSGTDWQQ